MKPIKGRTYIATQDDPCSIPIKTGALLVCVDEFLGGFEIIKGASPANEDTVWYNSLCHGIELVAEIEAGFEIPISPLPSLMSDEDIAMIQKEFLKQSLALRFKKLDEDAVLPSRGKPGDIGLDITVISREWNTDRGCYVYGTGLAVELPPGHAGFLLPRSSSYKKDLILTNHVGLIDPNYRGEIKAIYRPLEPGNRYEAAQIFEPGERALQLVVVPVPAFEPEWADELSDSNRGDKGFGSSGA